MMQRSKKWQRYSWRNRLSAWTHCFQEFTFLGKVIAISKVKLLWDDSQFAIKYSRKQAVWEFAF